MQSVRHLFAQRYCAILICTAALLVKLLVPSGYMLGGEHGRLMVEICPGVTSQPAAMDMPQMHGNMPDHGKSKEHGRAEIPCAFSGLSTASLAAVDPIQLAILIAFVLSMGLVGSVLLLPSRRVQLRPPLRGPPAIL